jgi:trk system potassium uptake protein TrkA
LINGGKENVKSILLIGLGRFGRHIAIKLDELNHQVMALDKNESRVEAVLPYVRNAQIGDATNEDFIRSLGVRNFDVCIVAIGDNFQSSLEATSLLKELGAKMVVSRAARDVHAKFLLRNGADEVVYPEKQLASWTAIRYSADHIFDYVELDEKHGIFEISIPDAWVGKTVGKLDIRKRYNVNIMALRCHGVLDMNISPDTVLEEYQTMLVLGNIKNIQKQFHI